MMAAAAEGNGPRVREKLAPRGEAIKGPHPSDQGGEGGGGKRKEIFIHSENSVKIWCYSGNFSVIYIKDYCISATEGWGIQWCKVCAFCRCCVKCLFFIIEVRMVQVGSEFCLLNCLVDCSVPGRCPLLGLMPIRHEGSLSSYVIKCVVKVICVATATVIKLSGWGKVDGSLRKLSTSTTLHPAWLQRTQTTSVLVLLNGKAKRVRKKYISGMSGVWVVCMMVVRRVSPPPVTPVTDED